MERSALRAFSRPSASRTRTFQGILHLTDALSRRAYAAHFRPVESSFHRHLLKSASPRLDRNIALATKNPARASSSVAAVPAVHSPAVIPDRSRSAIAKDSSRPDCRTAGPSSRHEHRRSRSASSLRWLDDRVGGLGKPCRRSKRRAAKQANCQSVGDRIAGGIPGVVGVDWSTIRRGSDRLTRSPDSRL